MSLGYFALCFGGRPGVTMLEYQGKQVPVTVAQKASEEGGQAKGQVVKIDDVEYRIEGQEDGSLKLASSSPERLIEIPKGEFDFVGQRNQTYVYLMFLALTCVILGNGFFKPNISTMVGSLYAPNDSRARRWLYDFLHGDQPGSHALAVPLSVASGSRWLVGGFWTGGHRNVRRLSADSIRWWST